MSRWPVRLRAGLTLAGACAAGWACDNLGLPLGWLIGPMLVMMAAAATGLPAVQPSHAVPWVKSCVGTFLGASITWPVLQAVPGWWVPLTAMFATVALSSCVNFALLRRGFGFGPVDAALCAAPGGIAEMILLGETAGADARRVAIVHALRIALSILVLPLLLMLLVGEGVSSAAPQDGASLSWADWGWLGLCVLSGVLAARYTPIPLPFVLVPGLLCAGLHLGNITQFEVPGSVAKLMQIVIGINVGARFQNTSLRQLLPVFGAAASVFLVQLLCATVGALGVARLVGLDQMAATLAYAPGGLAEMSLIAIAMGRDVAFVGLHHLLRVLSALLITPLVLARLQGRSK